MLATPRDDDNTAVPRRHSNESAAQDNGVAFRFDHRPCKQNSGGIRLQPLRIEFVLAQDLLAERRELLRCPRSGKSYRAYRAFPLPGVPYDDGLFWCGRADHAPATSAVARRAGSALSQASKSSSRTMVRRPTLRALSLP